MKNPKEKAYVCETCSAEFTRHLTPAHEKRNPPRYCNRECFSESLKKPITEKEFWSFVHRKGPCDCWGWKRSLSGGYGNMTRGGTHYRSHRLAFAFAKGAIPAGLWVLHTCDNRSCCNPKHLYAGTPLQNAKDRESRGRTYRGSMNAGETNRSAKLNRAQVAMIRRQSKRGVSPQQLASHFSISIGHCRRIVRGERWRR